MKKETWPNEEQKVLYACVSEKRKQHDLSKKKSHRARSTQSIIIIIQDERFHKKESVLCLIERLFDKRNGSQRAPSQPEPKRQTRAQQQGPKRNQTVQDKCWPPL